MATKRQPNLRAKLLDLARLATSAEAHEARTAALKVCEILRNHGDTLLVRREAGGVGPEDPPARPSRASEVHPRAAEYRAWRSLLASQGLVEQKAKVEGFCNSCGDGYSSGEAIVGKQEHGFTHEHCAGWWWNYQFPPEEDEFPF